MKVFGLSIALVISLASSTAALAAPQLYEGRYNCSLGPNIHIGNIWLYADGTYAGPSNDEGGDRKPFEITDAGTINWGGDMGGLNSGGNTITGTVIKDAGNDRAGFDIQFQSESGGFSTASCGPDF